MKKSKIVLSFDKMLIVFIVGFAQCTIFMFPYVIFGFYKPLQDSLQCTNEQLGFLMSLMGIMAVLCFLPGGWVADRVNPKKLIISGLVITGICVFVCTIFVNYTVYCAMWIIMSIAGALLYWSAGMKIVRVNTDPDEQGKAYGYFYCVNNLCTAGANAVGSALLVAFSASVLLGFKYYIIFLGALNFVAAIIVWKWVPLHQISKVKTDADENDDGKICLKDLKYVLTRKETWLFAFVVFCLYGMTNIVTYFTPYFSDVMNLSVASAAIIFTVTGPLGAFCGPIMGTIADWFGSTLKAIVWVTLLTLVLLLVMVFVDTLTLTEAIAIDAAVSAISVGIYSIGFAAIEEIGMERRVAGTCIGVASVIGYCPDVFMFAMFGKWLDIYENAGYKYIFIFGVTTAAIAVVCASWLFLIAQKKKLSVLKQTNVLHKDVTA